MKVVWNDLRIVMVLLYHRLHKKFYPLILSNVSTKHSIFYYLYFYNLGQISREF